ncbi:hypothetical protein CDD83_6001 [Cordyceps sp. RAO-2017]|nr:hypothetical protein CDD83_6001 [Cordyceps sp. RAO-2017]
MSNVASQNLFALLGNDDDGEGKPNLPVKTAATAAAVLAVTKVLSVTAAPAAIATMAGLPRRLPEMAPEVATVLAFVVAVAPAALVSSTTATPPGQEAMAAPTSRPPSPGVPPRATPS